MFSFSIYAGAEKDVHFLIHAVKGTFCLSEEIIYDTLAEFANFVIVVHLEYLVKGWLVYDIPKIRCRARRSFALAYNSEKYLFASQLISTQRSL